MRLINILGFLVLILLLVKTAYASSGIITFNQDNGKVLIEEEYNLDSEKEININIPKDAISIYSNVNYTKDGEIISIIGKDVKISYISNYLIEKANNDYFFINKYISPDTLNNLKVRLILKEGFIVDDKDIFPKDYKIETDGKKISIVWNFKDIGKDESLALFVKFNNTSSSKIYTLWIALVIVLAVIIYGVYFFYKRNKKSKKFEKHLIDSEKKVIEELKKADRGEMWQKQLQLKTGFSKAKLSRVIRNLESRNLISKIPFGNTNKIGLK